MKNRRKLGDVVPLGTSHHVCIPRMSFTLCQMVHVYKAERPGWQQYMAVSYTLVVLINTLQGKSLPLFFGFQLGWVYFRDAQKMHADVCSLHIAT